MIVHTAYAHESSLRVPVVRSGGVLVLFRIKPLSPQNWVRYAHWKACCTCWIVVNGRDLTTSPSHTERGVHTEERRMHRHNTRDQHPAVLGTDQGDDCGLKRPIRGTGACTGCSTKENVELLLFILYSH